MGNVRETAPGLASAIEDRRRELRLSPGDLAERTGVTRQGLAPLRRGERRQYQDRLTFAVCRALGWTPDSIDRLLRGEPAVLATTAGAPSAATRAAEPAVDVVQQIASLRADLERLALVVEDQGLRIEEQALVLHRLPTTGQVHDGSPKPSKRASSTPWPPSEPASPKKRRSSS